MENKANTILVLGANGKTGSRVAKKLEDLSLSVRRGSRSGDPAFDWEDESAWEPVLQGIFSVYITFQPDLAVAGAEESIRRFAALALKNGVQKLVLLSGRGEPEAQRCEQIIIESGLKWTIVRASWFSQNFSESHLLDPIVAGFVALPAGDVREPFIDAEDIADVVVASLTSAGHDSKIYELTGSRMLTFREAVAEIASASNRTIEYKEISVADYAAMLKDYQVPDEIIGLASYLFSEVLDGRNQSITDGVAQALGRPPRDFSQYVNDTVGSKVWSLQ